MGKLRIASSSNINTKKKRHLQDYFEIRNNPMMTPNQRSLAKDKKMFHPPTRKKSNKKDTQKDMSKRLSQAKVERLSQAKVERKKEKENFSPAVGHMYKSGHKGSKYEHSINKEYDSPSKDHEQIDFIFKGAQKNVKGSTIVEQAIEKVNLYLKDNHLPEAINVLTETLQVQPQNYDVSYLLGICYIFNSSYDQAINIFDNLLHIKPRKNIYLLLSVCFKRTEDYPETQKILEECIRKYPKYYEAYIYRGKLSLRMKQYKKALVDFQKAVTLDPHKHIGLIGKGDCLRLMEKYDQAKHLYTAVYNAKKNNSSLLLRRAICNMELKKLEPALDDINRLLETESENSQALYFKGLIFNKLKQQNDAIICYEQAIKFNSNKRAVTRSIYEITKIKIENRDYYEALFTLERAEYLDIDEKVIKKFQAFTQGVTSLMKKNFAEGIKTLTELLDDQEKPVSNFLKPIIYSSRSYGYMALEKYQNAKDDLDAMETQFCLDLPNLFNKFICEGILACNNQKYQNALALFSKAGKALHYRIEPAFYKAVTLICFATKLIPKEMKQKKKEYLESAMKTVLKGEANIQNNPSLFMIRGLLYYIMGDSQKALEDFDKCWSESTKPNPLVFYLTGLIFGESGKYPEAINEFNRAIENDEKHLLPEAFLNRAKCMLLTGEVNNGFVDLQSYMSYRPSSPEIHIWAGHLLFFIGAYEDAAKAYSNISNINKNFEVLFHRAKCYLTCKDVLNAIANLKLMLEIKYDNKTYFDFQILECLRECSDENMSEYGRIREIIKETKKKTSMGDSMFGNLFKEPDYQFYKGVMYFYEKKYVEASKNFKRALDLKEKEIQEIGEEDHHLLDFYKLSFANRCFNYFQIIYNIAITEIIFGNLAKASKLLKGVIDKIPEGEVQNQFMLFANLLSKQIANQFNRAKPSKPSEEEAEFFPFPAENRLCSIFPEVTLPFSTPIKTRLYFCLPYVQKPDISPKFDEKILEQISMNTIEIKPEAPWIRRSDEGVIFTDEIIKYDIELSKSSTSRSKSGEDEQEHDALEDEENEEQEYDEDADIYEKEGSDQGHYQNSDEEVKAPMNPNQLKQFFKLDKGIEEKLARLQLK